MNREPYDHIFSEGMLMGGPMNRRTFNQAAVATTAWAALQTTSRAALGSNERVRLGFIGVGNRGDQLLDAFLVHKDAEIVALCDVYEPYLQAAQKKVGGKATLYHDFRRLIDQKDIHAVVIATPGPLARFAVRRCLPSGKRCLRREALKLDHR